MVRVSKDVCSFNMELIHSKTPVISAVGHEDEVTLCDLVADRRASTPTMAASLTVQNRDDVQNHINHLNSILLTFIFTKLESNKKEFEIYCRILYLLITLLFIPGHKMHFENLCSRFGNVSRYDKFK